MVYKEVWRNMVVRRTGGGHRVRALVYVVDQSHEQYAGKRTARELLPFVLQGHGKGGPCIDYIAATLEHIREQGFLRSAHGGGAGAGLLGGRVRRPVRRTAVGQVRR
jgi:cation transport regulator ChaC